MHGLKWEEVIVYLDDITVIGTDFSDTIAALRIVIDRFCQHNLKLKGRNYLFFQTSSVVLGKMVSGDGTSISSNKLEAVERWSVPQIAKKLLSFLGFINYYCNHMPSFSMISADLFTLAHAKVFV